MDYVIIRPGRPGLADELEGRTVGLHKLRASQAIAVTLAWTEESQAWDQWSVILDLICDSSVEYGMKRKPQGKKTFI